VSVDGTAGDGKTALVVRAAHEIRRRYPDGCLFVDLHTHSVGAQKFSPLLVLQRLLRSVGAVAGEMPGDLDELTAVWRTTTSSLRLLVVLDDAPDPWQIRPLLPAGSGSKVIVTSRQRLAGLDADQRVTLELMKIDDAVSLLRHIVGAARADEEPDATTELARLCDGLPLALRIAGARLQTRPSWQLAYLVRRMADHGQRLGELRVGDRSVEAAFGPSYDQLPPEQQHGFRVLGLAPTVEFDRLTAAAMLGWPARDAEQMLENLVDTSLLQQPRPGRYRMHDLVRVHARRLAETVSDEAGPARTAALRLFLEAGRITSDWGPGAFPTGPGPIEAPFAGWKDAAGWLDEAGGELADVVGYAVEFGETDYACWIAEALTDHFLRRGRYSEAHTALKAALAHADASTDRRMSPALRNCLGLVDTFRIRPSEAHAWYNEALHISREYGDPHQEIRALVGLGVAEMNMGHAERAGPYLLAALELPRQDDDDWLLASAYGTLGFVRHDQGRNEEALGWFRAAHAHAKAVACRALSTSFNDTPERASRPYDRDRDGFVMGEGAGIVVLEDYEHAQQRGARIYAELIGYGLSGDAHHITAPAADGDGALRCMNAAIKRAGISAAEIDYINAHGTSTPLGDEIELGAAQRLLGNATSTVSMSSTKSSTGHLLGAAGAVEAIFCILAIRDNLAPPTINLDNPSVETAIDLVPNAPRKREINVALSNSFGFGGTNASVIVQRVTN